MKNKPRQPAVPPDRKETIRQGIVSALEGKTLTAKELSGLLRVPEKEVYDHLEHIRKTVHKTGSALVVVPAECIKCGFVFRKRERLKRPGRCPVCHGESIEEPSFRME
ncbi:MAG: transcriptional regulator [Nitrospiraceae bacterium]|nr:MAG: transcriptional regulator [Nitrospiraceae bacterium]